MNTGLDLSMWPPALAFALIVIVLVCHVLPDVLTIAPVLTSPRSSGATRKKATGPKTSAGR